MQSKDRKPNWYVITGVPSSGISTLADALKPYVDCVFPEAARAYIDKNLEKGIPVSETRADEGAFQRKVLKMKLLNEGKTEKSKTCLFERGVPDSIPYFKVAGLDSEPLKKFCKDRYKIVFHLEPLDYEKDYARTESAETRKRLDALLMDTYKDLGYTVVRIPTVPVEERTRIVLSYLKK